MKKLESKWTYAVLLLPMIFCVFYSKLCDVNAMMKESRLIFDPYGSAGITWAYWNSISKITWMLFLALSLVSILTVVGAFCNYKSAKKAAYITIILNTCGVLWLFILTLAEKNTALMQQLAKIFALLSGVKYSKQANIVSNTYFADRAMVLGILFASLIICCIIIARTKIKENNNLNLCKIVGFGLIVSFVRSLLQQYWQSNTMIKALGVGNKENQELFSQMFQLKGEYSWYFDFPILELIIMAVLLCTFDRKSKTKNIITGGVVALLIQSSVILGVMLHRINNLQQVYQKEQELFYSKTLKADAVSQCIGLYVFDFISIFMLLLFLKKETTFLKIGIAQICVLLISVLCMKLIGTIQNYGIVVGIVSAVVFICLYIINTKLQKCKSENWMKK